MYSVWVKEGPRGRAGRKSGGLSHSIEEMDSLYDQENKRTMCWEL